LNEPSIALASALKLLPSFITKISVTYVESNPYRLTVFFLHFVAVYEMLYYRIFLFTDCHGRYVGVALYLEGGPVTCFFG